MDYAISKLRELRNELSERIAAIDKAISVLEITDFENERDAAANQFVDNTKQRNKGRAKKSSGIDMTTVPDFNAYGRGGIRTDL